MEETNRISYHSDKTACKSSNALNGFSSGLSVKDKSVNSHFDNSDFEAHQHLKLPSPPKSPKSEIVIRNKQNEGQTKNSSAPKEKKGHFFQEQSIGVEKSKSSSVTTSKRITKFTSLYQLQHKACQLVKKRKNYSDKRAPLAKAVVIHSNILSLVTNYEAFNMIDHSLTIKQKLQNKIELREIKMSSILLKMKASKKL
jgi:hypothetical protein